jgi:DNA helicase-2/ATP-dependent DNA helicase PcrA
MDALNKFDGPCVVMAGAGTGKTHTIVEKLKNMIASGNFKPERIVCITFSNEAANSLLTRAQRNVALEPGKEPIIRTFHGFSADLLRKYGMKIGIKEDFAILEPDEAKVVLHRNFKVNAYNCHRYIGAIGTAKDLGITISELKEYLEKESRRFDSLNLEEEFEKLSFEFQTLHLRREDRKKRELNELLRRIGDIIELKKFIGAWEGYEKLKLAKNYQDYSDLNANALLLLKQHPEVAGDFDYVIVDEFQDTNKIQVEMLIALSPKGNITIVGDMNQSIYRFRGAYKDNYSLFKKEFNVKDSDIFTLDKSRRSPDSVLRTAHKLILNNYSDKGECFEVKNYDQRKGEKIPAYELKNGKEEARKIAELVQSEIDNGIKAEDICVMFRTHQQGRIIRQVLENSGIKYCSVSKASLFDQKSVKSILNYLTIAHKLVKHEKGGESSWWEIVFNSGMLESDLIAIGKFLKQHKEDENISESLLKGLAEIELTQLGKLLSKIILERVNMLVLLAGKDIQEILKESFRICGLLSATNLRERKEVMMNLDKLLAISKIHSQLYGSELDSFLNYVEVVKSLGIEIEAPELEDAGVRLMTLHATKGLEYHSVIVSNLAQKRFPMEKISSKSLIPLCLMPEFRGISAGKEELDYYAREFERENQLKEERRLCYVAFTRAKEKLILTFAKDYAGKKHYPSQFLQEINYMNNEDIAYSSDFEEKYKSPNIISAQQISFLTADKQEFLIDIPSRTPLISGKPDLEQVYFSPSALLLFEECQKQYEYKYIYNMPEKKTYSWEAMRLGSFVHEVLEIGVQKKFKNARDFIDLAREMHLKEDWQAVEFSEALHMIKVFFERNKNKINEKSKTEQQLNAKLGNYNFLGYADRIDFHDNGIEIVDYKTGKQQVAPKHREWQLGYYALAAKSLGLGEVKRITLDMLKLEKPVEFEVLPNGDAISINSDARFNINDVKNELLESASRIIEAYESGFKPCPVEKGCDFCNEYVYGL